MKLCCMTVPKSSHTFEALGVVMGTHGELRVGMHPHGRLWRAMIAHHVDMMGAAQPPHCRLLEHRVTVWPCQCTVSAISMAT